MARKKYINFLAGTYDTAKIFLQADPITGSLEKINLPSIPTYIGTTNRITVTAGIIDISAAFVGQSSITTLGTITTGTWNATTIDTTKGGTGLTTYTTGDLLYASATNTLSKLAVGTSGQVLKISAGLPSWATFAATPAGSDTNIQYNNAGAFGASANFTWDNSSKLLTVTGTSPSTNALTVSGRSTFAGTIVSSATGAESNLKVSSASNGLLFYAGGLAFQGHKFSCLNSYSTGSHYVFTIWNDITTIPGTTTIGQLLINPTYNTSSGSCTAIGILYEPSLTAIGGITQHIAFKNSTGDNYFGTVSGNVGIGANSSINSSAILDITSTSKGLLFPRMTTTQKNAISTPAEGLVIYDTTLHKLCVRTASAWETVTSA